VEVIVLNEQLIMPSLKKRLINMAEDERETLKAAFALAITSPEYVAAHNCYAMDLCDVFIEFHHFRIGYATFIIAVIDGCPAILWDFFLMDHEFGEHFQ
jgi:hypothetical protein